MIFKENRTEMVHLKDKTLSIIFAVLFVGTAVVLFWRAKYGYVNFDEAFYLTVPYRLFQGDALFLDEWAPSQMSGFLSYPFVWLFIRITGGTEGIYLYIRILYTVFKCILSLFIYFVFRRFNHVGAVLSSLCFEIFSSYCLAVLSYNSLAIGGLLLSTLFIVIPCRKQCIQNMLWGLSGFFLAVSVLAMPTLIFLYVLYGIAVLAAAVRKKTAVNEVYGIFFSPRAFLFVTAGAALLALLFFGFVFSRITMNEFITSLPNLFNDPEHQGKALWKIIPGYFARIIKTNYATVILYPLIFIDMVCMLVDRKRDTHRCIYFLLSFVLGFLLLAVYLFYDGYINYLFFAVDILAFLLLFITKDGIIRSMGVVLWLPGMLYSFLEYILSNTGFSGISSAASVAGAGSILIIVLVSREIMEEDLFKRRWIPYMMSGIILTVLILGLLYMRITYIFWEGPIREQTVYLTRGSQAGILVDEEDAERYNGMLQDVEAFDDNVSYVLYLADETLYLNGTQRFSTYSGLAYGVSMTRDILYKYYEVHPERMPDAVYITSRYAGLEDELYESLNMSHRVDGVQGIVLYR